MLIEAPEGEATLYRNFIDGAGPRAIGVGYHEGVNLAFDANNMRLAMIWHGEFIDGARHWIGRGQGFQPPAGSDVIRLPDGVVITELENSDSVWPGSEYRTRELDFEGYTLDKFQRPTFKYSREDISITDKVIPVNSIFEEKPGKLRRIVKFSSDEAPSNLYFLWHRENLRKTKRTMPTRNFFFQSKAGKFSPVTMTCVPFYLKMECPSWKLLMGGQEYNGTKLLRYSDMKNFKSITLPCLFINGFR